ncbi:MAG: vitamin B12 dependent-methionine synthase activation domain-containing protein [Oscillospiraceae bacterium]|nr:vitamin B12 dependent-methionine synthase activation domain-containing protein [Oscillospiraceae bacterium]
MKDELRYFFRPGRDLLPDKSEALRYMGYRSGADNEAFERLYEECLGEFMAAASYKAVARPAHINKDGELLDFGFCRIENGNLAKNLTGCRVCWLFAATAGAGIDRLIRRYSVLSPAKAMIIDCIASSAVEVWCDEVCRELAHSSGACKPRFSPGYGGVSLDYQKGILAFLDAGRKLGLTLTDSLLMTPKKSVTAFVGIKDQTGIEEIE